MERAFRIVQNQAILSTLRSNTFVHLAFVLMPRSSTKSKHMDTQSWVKGAVQLRDRRHHHPQGEILQWTKGPAAARTS